MAQHCTTEKCEDLRIVLLGKTGVGKSASGNTILGREAFISDIIAASVTAECQKERAEVNGRAVYVVDTPGLYDTRHKNEEIMKEIVKCICLSSPGPHVFLVVIQLGRFTAEEQDTVKWIKEIFGRESDKYTMVLFTHGDKLKGKSIEEFMSSSTELKDFYAQCRGGYHVFNNEDPENRSQVTKLLQKIDKMVTVNGGGFYTTEMYKIAESVIERRKAEILKETEEKRKIEEEELEKQIKKKVESEKKRAKEELRKAQERAEMIEEERKRELVELERHMQDKAELKLKRAKDQFRKEQEESARRQAELDDEVLRLCSIIGAIGGAITGVITGAVAGAFMGGPVGGVIGAGVGAAGGAGAGAAIGAGGGAAKRSKCTIQ